MLTALCPRCDGKGTVEDVLSDTTRKIKICPDCKGTGVWNPPVGEIYTKCPHCGKEIEVKTAGYQIDEFIPNAYDDWDNPIQINYG